MLAFTRAVRSPAVLCTTTTSPHVIASRVAGGPGRPGTAAVLVRLSSMSAITRGLRRTFRGQRAPGHDPRVAARVSERRRLREAAPKPTYKILKGKKDITEDPIPEPKTRAARFFDPDDKFGKRSLVYRFKSGELQDELQSLKQKKRESGGEDVADQGRRHSRDYSRDSGRDYSRDYGRDSGRDSRRDSGRDSGRGQYRDREPLRTRPREQRDYQTRDAGRDRPREQTDYEARGRGRDWSREQTDYRSRGRTGRDQPDYSRGRTGDRPERREQPWDQRGRNERDERKQDWAPSSRRERSEREPGRSDRSDRSDRPSPGVPLEIPYTTAASQFLYGRSVVEAALRSGRRQLYKLYLYGGSSERGPARDSPVARDRSALEQAARRQGVATQTVDERWQRLLDKMSKGRPHNGCVLEASPLPQPPTTKLGAYDAARGGFAIALGHQSREEAAVNGPDTFVPVTGTGYKPLVLLLDQVLDPGNLGAILRSASFLGVSAVAVSKHGSATLTSVALKASAGAAEVLPLLSVDEPATFLAQSREAGWRVFAAVAPGSTHKTKQMDLAAVEAADPLRETPSILVMGSEGEGLSRAIRREADVEVSVANRSGSDVVDSLNVSVATGLLCASFLRGRAAAEAKVQAQTPTQTTQTTQSGFEAEMNKKLSDDLGIW